MGYSPGLEEPIFFNIVFLKNHKKDRVETIPDNDVFLYQGRRGPSFSFCFRKFIHKASSRSIVSPCTVPPKGVAEAAEDTTHSIMSSAAASPFGSIGQLRLHKCMSRCSRGRGAAAEGASPGVPASASKEAASYGVAGSWRPAAKCPPCCGD